LVKRSKRPKTYDLRPSTCKVAAVSLGCPKNLTDTEVMLGKLLEQGYEIVRETANADVLLINTCAFIESARSEAYGTIAEYARLKKKQHIKKIVIAGCLPVYDREALLERFPEIDLAIGPAEIYRLPELIERPEKELMVGSLDYELQPGNRLVTSGPGYAYLKIAEGCDHRCAFCTIPRLRGPFRSKPRELIFAEARSLVAGGVKELVLVAQDTTRYGLDMDGTLQLPSLLRELAGIEGLHWLRVMYGHPLHVTEELLEVIAREEKVCKYLDLPLQHIDDEVLKNMKRGIGEEEVRKLIGKIKKKIPELALRTTFITGYPGETDTQFKKMLEFLEEAKFTRAGFFIYSAEKGTSAAAHKEVPREIAEYRYGTLMRIQQRISKEQNEMMIGKELTVLMGTATQGRSYRDAPEIDGTVSVRGKNIRPGTMIRTRITSASEYDLAGEAMS
jgi:ribosomal protein S12 methylthiotransferase